MFYKMQSLRFFLRAKIRQRWILDCLAAVDHLFILHHNKGLNTSKVLQREKAEEQGGEKRFQFAMLQNREERAPAVPVK